MSKSRAFQAFQDKFQGQLAEALPKGLTQAVETSSLSSKGLPSYLKEILAELAEDDIGTGAGARPSHAGGNKGSTDTDTSGGGKGKGKTKKASTDDSDTTGDTGTDTGGTDTGGTDTGGTDTGGADTSGYITADYTSGLDTPDGFNISIIFDGFWSDAQKSEIYKAAEALSDLITGDVADTDTYIGRVDDIAITASMADMDGVGGIAGWGGYNSVRTTGDALPSVGYLRLDTADAGSLMNGGILDDFMAHEMLHALGFGTAWQSAGLVETIDGELRFTGENAIEAYNTAFADIAAGDANSHLGVPVEMEGGSGTAGVHWDEDLFGGEIMTGWLDWTNTTSDLTIASLEDLGYQTIFADDFAIV